MIAARARREGAEIHWGDETCLSTRDPRGRGFAARGRAPVLGYLPQRASLAFLSTITNQGKVRAWVHEHRDALAVYYLPPYAPERNPDEYRNNDRRLGVATRAPAPATPGLAEAARSHQRTLQRRPDRVRRFLERPRITYAA